MKNDRDITAETLTDEEILTFFHTSTSLEDRVLAIAARRVCYTKKEEGQRHVSRVRVAAAINARNKI